MPKHSKNNMLLSKSKFTRPSNFRVRTKKHETRPKRHRGITKKQAKSIAELQTLISHIDIKSPVSIRIEGLRRVFYNFGTKFDRINKGKYAKGFDSAISNVSKWDSLLGNMIGAPLKNAILAGTYAIITRGLSSEDPSFYQKVLYSPSIKLSDKLFNIVKDRHNIDNGLKLALATKVTWYISGESDIKSPVLGFTQSYLHSVFHYNGKIPPVVSDAVQKFGRLLDTKIALKILGVLPGGGKYRHILPTGEMMDRVLEFPAGASYLSTAYEIFSYVSESIYMEYIGNNEIIKRVEEIVANNVVDRAAYHVSSPSLGLLKRRVDLSHNDMIFISAVVHAIAPGSNLSKKKSIIPRNQLKFNPDYLMLSKICRLLEAKGEVFNESRNKENCRQKIRSLIKNCKVGNNASRKSHTPSTIYDTIDAYRGPYNEEEDGDYVYKSETEDELESNSEYETGDKDGDKNEGPDYNIDEANDYEQVKTEDTGDARYSLQPITLEEQISAPIKSEPSPTLQNAIEGLQIIRPFAPLEPQVMSIASDSTQLPAQNLAQVPILDNDESVVKEEFLNGSANHPSEQPDGDAMDDDDIIFIKIETTDQV